MLESRLEQFQALAHEGLGLDLEASEGAVPLAELPRDPAPAIALLLAPLAAPAIPLLGLPGTLALALALGLAGLGLLRRLA